MQGTNGSVTAWLVAVVALIVGLVLWHEGMQANPQTDQTQSDPVQFHDAAPDPVGHVGPMTMPGPNNTGPTNLNILRPSGSITVTTPGAVIQNLAITGTVDIEAPNVTMENCTVDGGCEIGTPGAAAGPTSASDITCCIWIHPGATGAVIKNVSVTGTGPGAGYAIDNDGGNATLLDDRVYNTSGEGIRLSASTLMEGCWMYDIGWDGLGITNGSNVGYEHTADLFIYNDSDNGPIIFRDNNFQTGQTTDNGLTYRPYADFFIDTFKPGWTVNNVTITNNYIDGGASAAFYCMSQGTVNISNNLFGPNGAVAGVYANYVGDTINWSNNVVQSTGRQLSAPVVSGNKVVTQPQPN